MLRKIILPLILLCAGPAAFATSVLRDTNNTRIAGYVSIEAGNLSTLGFPAKRVPIAAGETVAIDLGVLRFGDDTHILHVRTVIENERGERRQGKPLFEPLRVSGGRIERISFEETFPRMIQVEGGAGGICPPFRWRLH